MSRPRRRPARPRGKTHGSPWICPDCGGIIDKVLKSYDQADVWDEEGHRSGCRFSPNGTQWESVEQNLEALRAAAEVLADPEAARSRIRRLAKAGITPQASMRPR